MQRLPLKVMTTKGWSKKAPSNAACYVRRGVLVGLMLLLVGCGGDDAASPGAATDEMAIVGGSDEISPAADSLLEEAGDQSVADRIRDASIAAEVQLALTDAKELRAFRLEPVAVDGRVVLQGEVQTPAQREQASSIASGVEGVRDVINEITSVEQPTVAMTRESEPASDTASQDGEDTTAAEAPTASTEQPPADVEDEPAESQAAYHTVRSGDNLWDIARSYDVSVDQIRRLNNLGSNNLQPGDRLRVK